MPLTVLIADDESAARHALKRALARLDCELIEAADDRIETAIECVRLGAADYITKPYEAETRPAGHTA